MKLYLYSISNILTRRSNQFNQNNFRPWLKDYFNWPMNDEKEWEKLRPHFFTAKVEKTIASSIGTYGSSLKPHQVPCTACSDADLGLVRPGRNCMGLEKNSYFTDAGIKMVSIFWPTMCERKKCTHSNLNHLLFWH